MQNSTVVAALMSSTDVPAERAVDGQVPLAPGNLSNCAMSQPEASAWWAVELAATNRLVTNILITTRPDCCGGGSGLQRGAVNV